MNRHFTDKTIIHIEAGKGGDGVISFHKGRTVGVGKPDGGHGGNGGNVFLQASRSYEDLSHTKNMIYKAPHGENGGRNNRTGKKGNDLFIRLPLNTSVYMLPTNYKLGILEKDGDILKVANGGKLGLGNIGCIAPQDILLKRKVGMPGDHISLSLSMSLVADVCFIGLPNTGKSTLVNIISGSRFIISSYPFSTLFPQISHIYLDYMYDLTVLDMPSLTSGSSLGAGLGYNFLKHAENCKILVYVLDVSDNSHSLSESMAICENEIAQFNVNLLQKNRLIVLNKIDHIDNLESVLDHFIKQNNISSEIVIPISCVTFYNIEKLVNTIRDMLHMHV